MTYDITVIIPAYNAEKHIVDTLDSIVNQTFDGILEIIVIDDCSKDNTVEVVRNFTKLHTEMEILFLKQKENMRQGAARNRGLDIAKGKYIFFLDADDFLHPEALETLHKKAEKDLCDFVLCDWIYFYEDKGLVYVNNDRFLFKDLLLGEEIEDLYQANSYFSVNKLYNKEFLSANKIKYGEGYIYEDFEFYVNVIQYANIVGIVQNPYYRVRVNDQSTTKVNTDNTLHLDSLVVAVENSLKHFNPRSKYSYYHVYKYFFHRTLLYTEKRAPKKYQKETVKNIVKILNDHKTDYPVPNGVVPLYHFFFRRNYIQENKINKILIIWRLYNKGKLNKLFARAKKIKDKLQNFKLWKKFKAKKRQKKILDYYKEPIKRNLILFMGFDYRYIGNSKYLFDYLQKNEKLKLYFVTKDTNVPEKYRISPRSYDFYEKFAQAKVVIFESWLPLAFRKREGSTWIQLWHGTPFKKLFFDSHEYYISSFNRNHKKNKKRDISRWDYLLSDTVEAGKKLTSAFDFDENRILNYGYPRVQWLKDNKSNQSLKREIKEKIGIPDNKKVVFYAPTWRDYNYKVKNVDLSYLMDIKKVLENLSDDYVLMYKSHSMERKQEYNKNIINPPADLDTQNLILISDFIISDFSSIIFDGLAIDIPFYLFINDFEKYAKARGVYLDLDVSLRSFYVNDELSLVEKIKEINTNYPTSEYDEIKERYSSFEKDSNTYEKLESMIEKLVNQTF